MNKLSLLILLSFLTCCKKENTPDPIIEPNTTYIIDARDGNKYNIVKIGNQWWMADNLSYRTEGGSYFYNNDSLNYSKFGRLYLWDTLMNGSGVSNSEPSGVKGLCPNGWHIPSDKEFKTLEEYLVDSNMDGGDLKSTDTTFWAAPNVGGTNKTGFNALGAGTMYYSDNWKSANQKTNVDFISTTIDISTGGVWGRGLTYNTNNFYRWPIGRKENAWSCRCVKD